MEILIYGLGVVGGALAKYLEKDGDIRVIKKDPRLGFDQVPEGRLSAIFLCVPIPTAHWKQDLSIVEEILEDWRGSQIPIFMRSTVLPGTCDELSYRFQCNIISLPEFLTERIADEDMNRLPIIVGEAGILIASDLFFNKEIVAVPNREAEMAKYVHNCFGAYKVTFFNAMYRMCQKLGLDFVRVRECALLSGHINEPHTQVPGPDGQLGFGGKCFPKDLEAMIGFMEGDPFGKMLLDIYCLNRFYRGIKTPDKMPKG